MGRDVDEPVVTGAALVGAVAASSGDPVRPDPPRSLDELQETLSVHGVLADVDAIEKKLREFYLAGTLTEREVEILRFASEGMSNAQTAEWLEISPETVRTHRMNAMRKLHMHTLTGAVGMAFRAGVLR